MSRTERVIVAAMAVLVLSVWAATCHRAVYGAASTSLQCATYIELVDVPLPPNETSVYLNRGDWADPLRVKVGEEFWVNISLLSADTPVNRVQFSIRYDAGAVAPITIPNGPHPAIPQWLPGHVIGAGYGQAVLTPEPDGAPVWRLTDTVRFPEPVTEALWFVKLRFRAKRAGLADFRVVLFNPDSQTRRVRQQQAGQVWIGEAATPVGATATAPAPR